MTERDPNIVTSGLSRSVTRDGITVMVSIYRLETDTDWLLEVVNDRKTSVVWDDPFPTDQAAMDEFWRTVEDEGMASFLDGAQILPFRR
jgi:uncharacterized protein